VRGRAAIGAVDVAHEARLRRWTTVGADGALGSWAWRAGRDEAASILVGPGTPVRIAALHASAARPERSAALALLAAGAELAISLGGGDGRVFGERAQALRAVRPDLVLVPLPDRDAADRLLELIEVLRFGCADQSPRPRVLLASDDDRAMAAVASGLASFPVEAVPDLRTDDGIRRFVARVRELRRGGIAELVLRDEAIEEVARALSARAGSPTLVVDVSGASTSLVRATPSGEVVAAHAVRLGTGRGADHVVARAGLERVRRWIPWAVDAPTLLEQVFNRARWPDAVPVDPSTLALEIALAHEAIGHALADADAAGISAPLASAPNVCLTGRLAALPRASQAVLVASDALEIAEVASIARDTDDAVIALAGAALQEQRQEERTRVRLAIAERAAPLGVLAPLEAGRRTRIRVWAGDATSDEPVARDQLFIIRAEGIVEIVATGAPMHGRGVAGPLGVVVDGRHRPLSIPVRDAERVPTVSRWYESLGAMPGVATGT